MAARRGIRLLGMLLAQLVPGSALPASPVPRPNFVVVVFDDLGYGDLGAYGSTFIQTPNVDRLAAEGTRFTRFYANAPSCSPSRAALMTGRHPVAVGIRTNLRTASMRGLPLEVPTLAEILKQAGYATGHFGKWHLGSSRAEDLPSARGFDRSVIGLRANFDQEDLLVDGTTTIPLEGHLTDVTTDYALEFLDAHRDESFFLSLWYHTPHRPWDPPPHWRQQYPASPTGEFAGMVSHGDEQVGRLVAALEQLGLDERTLVLVTSDNGGGLKNLASPLRGVKWDLYEGGIRVPLVAWWPGSVAAGRVEDAVGAGFDLAPTLLELAGVEGPIPHFDGQSLAGVLTGVASAPDRKIVWESTLRDDTDPDSPDGWNRWAVLEGDWKLVREDAHAPAELYDLALDPGELTNLAALEPEIVAKLSEHYAKWRRGVAVLSPGVERIEGEATVNGPWYEIDGGAAVLRPLSGLRVDDGDFTFQTRVWPSRTGGERTIAEQSGSWKLGLQGARPRLELWQPDGSRISFTSASRVMRDQPGELAFTIFAIPGSPSPVRFYLDGVLEFASEIDGLAVSDEPVRLGSDSSAPYAFEGLLWSPRLRRNALRPDELADRDGDGVPDSADLCIGVSDAPASAGGPQPDIDADGFGDACDVDFDGDGQVGMTDWLRLSAAYGSSVAEPAYDPVVDVDADGSIGALDLLRVLEAFGMRPGPSGVACDGSLLCYAP